MPFQFTLSAIGVITEPAIFTPLNVHHNDYTLVVSYIKLEKVGIADEHRYANSTKRAIAITTKTQSSVARH